MASFWEYQVWCYQDHKYDQTGHIFIDTLFHRCKFNLNNISGVLFLCRVNYLVRAFGLAGCVQQNSKRYLADLFFYIQTSFSVLLTSFLIIIFSIDVIMHVAYYYDSGFIVSESNFVEIQLIMSLRQWVMCNMYPAKDLVESNLFLRNFRLFNNILLRKCKIMRLFSIL